jgi:hypothetical protein
VHVLLKSGDTNAKRVKERKEGEKCGKEKKIEDHGSRCPAQQHRCQDITPDVCLCACVCVF